MNYRRALLIVELGKDTGSQVATLRRVAPLLEHLVVVAQLEVPALAWLGGKRTPEPDEQATAALEALHREVAGAASNVEVRLVPELGGEAIAASVRRRANRTPRFR